MRTSWFQPLALTFALAITTASSARAAIINVGFSGDLITAFNNTYDDPEIPVSDFFKVGQAFSGSVSYDTGLSGDFYSDSAEYELLGFNLSIGGQDFSNRFLPRSIYRSADGRTSFLAGGADQGGSTSLTLNLLSPFYKYPSPAELNGQTAEFRFDDYYPQGGQVFGLARLDTVVPAVPEPSSWLLMILGFGLAGWAVRNRNQKASLQAPQMA